MRHWKALLVTAIVAAVGLSVVAVAFAQTSKGAKPGTRRAVCGALVGNPKALKEMRALRAEHQKDMQAWRDKYGADPTSAEAQQALEELRQEHWNDMRDLFKKSGATVPQGRGFGMMGGGGCRGACGSGTGVRQGGAGYGGGMMGGYGGTVGAAY